MESAIDTNRFAWILDRADGWQFGEQGMIDAILERIGEGKRTCVEIGAGNGYGLPVTTERLLKRGWRCLWYEKDADNRATLCRIFGGGQNGNPEIRGEFTDESDVELRDVVCIDVDGLEYRIFSRYFDGCVKVHPPFCRLFMVEHADKNNEWANKWAVFRRETCGQAHPEGGIIQATESALVELAKRHGYTQVASTRINSIFVRDDLVCKLLDN